MRWWSLVLGRLRDWGRDNGGEGKQVARGERGLGLVFPATSKLGRRCEEGKVYSLLDHVQKYIFRPVGGRQPRCRPLGARPQRRWDKLLFTDELLFIPHLVAPWHYPTIATPIFSLAVLLYSSSYSFSR